MVQTLDQMREISQGDVEVVSINYTDWLDAGESLTGTPTVAEQVTNHLTIGNIQVSTGTLQIMTTTVAAGKALQFSISGAQASTEYVIRVTVSTDGTIPRTSVRDIRLTCVA